jgi:hypothetical protein
MKLFPAIDSEETKLSEGSSGPKAFSLRNDYGEEFLRGRGVYD